MNIVRKYGVVAGSRLVAAGVLAAVSGTAAPAGAQCAFTPVATGGNWCIATNWGCGVVPDASTMAALPAGNYAATVNCAGQTGSLDVGALCRVDVPTNASLTLWGPVLTNAGTVRATASFNGAVIQIAGDTQASGPGRVRLESPGGTAILSSINGSTLTNVAGHTISGWGRIDARIVNQGVILADRPTSGLSIQSSSLVNTGGTIRATNEGFVQLDAGTIRGGSLVSDGGGYFSGGSQGTVLRGTTLTAGSLMAITANQTVQIGAEGLVNNGLVDINVTFNGGVLNAAESATVSGTGVIRLRGGASPIVDTATGAILTNGQGHSIRGAGIINARLVNQGVLVGDVAGAALRLDGGERRENASGVIRAETGGLVQLVSGTVEGGVLQTDGQPGSEIQGGTSCVLRGCTLQGRMGVRANQAIQVGSQGLVNNGLLVVNPDGFNGADLSVIETATFGGTGEVWLASFNGGAELRVTAGQVLTNGPSHTISGVGDIYGSVVNQGTIAPAGTNLGSQTTANLDIFDGSFRNEATGKVVVEVRDRPEAFGQNFNGQYDRMSVAGQVTLNGGTLEVRFPTNYLMGNDSYPVLVSSSPILGNFASVTVVGGPDPTMQLSLRKVTWGAGGEALMLSRARPLACNPDCNRDSDVTVQDLFDYLDAWFAAQ